MEMFIGVLAILKAGGAYVPLDPAYPRERLAFMIEDSGISVLLTQKQVIEHTRLNSERGAGRVTRTNRHTNIICLDTDWEAIARETDQNPKRGVAPETPAYVIYTSGSTGRPKGVIGLHRGAVNRFVWMWRTIPFESNEKMCVKTSLSFVDSVWEMLGPLLQGVPVIIIADALLKDPERLIQTLADARVTRIVLVPSLLKTILAAVPDLRHRLRDLKLWSSSGEPLSNGLADGFEKSAPEAILLNLYGSSEVAGDVTCYDCRDRRPSSDVPIGRAISNTQIYILDSELQPVPIGVPGELYIGGDGVARGYLNRPELTAQRFVRNPFLENAQARLFRTGDVGRYKADGNIEFIGRTDQQVKVRGYRVELREVEAVLQRHPSVKDAVVIVREGGLLDQRSLMAYVVPQESAVPTRMDLRNFMARELPDYMIPSAFMMLNTFPLMPNGKIETSMLPHRDDSSFQVCPRFVEPRTEIEEIVAQVWRELLKQERIGVEDNFFAIGGHSLLAAQIISKLRSAFGRPLSLQLLFAQPTVGGLSRAIEAIMRRGEQSDLPCIVPVDRKEPLPISIAQESFFVVDQLIGGAAFFNVPYAYKLSGLLDVAALRSALAEIVSRHESLRTVFVERDGRPAQIVRERMSISVPLVDLSGLANDGRDEAVEQLAAEEAEQHFILGRGPLLRAKLVRLREDEHILFVTIHHIVTDQWSMDVFRSEFSTLYGAFHARCSSPLPKTLLQFADFVVWQKQLLDQGVFESQIGYWRRQLTEPSLQLDFQKRKGLSGAPAGSRVARQRFEIDFTLSESIKAFARRYNCTTFMVLVTALNTLLHVMTGERDIRICTLVANRGQDGTEGIIGYLANMIILRACVSPDMSSAELLASVKEICLEAYAHQDVPYDYLESVLQAGKSKPKAPMAQVMFNYRNPAVPPQEIPGLTIASWNGRRRVGSPGLLISYIDLAIHLRDSSTRLTGGVNYKTGIFSEERVAGMIRAFSAIIAEMTVRPATRIGDYDSVVDALRFDG
jgi:amino acid adenylation domain-containing protein